MAHHEDVSASCKTNLCSDKSSSCVPVLQIDCAADLHSETGNAVIHFCLLFYDPPLSTKLYCLRKTKRKQGMVLYMKKLYKDFKRGFLF